MQELSQRVNRGRTTIGSPMHSWEDGTVMMGSSQSKVTYGTRIKLDRQGLFNYNLKYCATRLWDLLRASNLLHLRVLTAVQRYGAWLGPQQ